MSKKSTSLFFRRPSLTPVLAVKLSLLSLVACFFQANATIYAQSINLKKNEAELTDIFRDIRKQSDYHIFYDARMLKNAQPVTLSLRNASIKEAMDQSLSGQGLTYRIVEKNIIIAREARKALPARREDNPVQDISITGKVSSEAGEPIPGVTIQVKNAQILTVSDDEGNYRIKVPDEG